ncbi:hypothetical protein [Rheinheimera sp.]|uniref:hypothetical protein n=1 Tax=Rheinheimera sp. TaxID=1869214 RepID=UPI003D2A1D96
MTEKQLEKFINRFKSLRAEEKPKFDIETIQVLEYFARTIADAVLMKCTALRVGLVHDGQKHDFNLLEDSSPIFGPVFFNLKKFPPFRDAKYYFQTTDFFLKNVLIPLNLKVQMILFEVIDSEGVLENYFKFADFNIESLHIRIELICSYLSSESHSSLCPSDAVVHVYSFFVDQFLRLMTLKGQLIQCLSYLENNLQNATSALQRTILLKSLIGFSTSYNLLSKRDLEDKLDEFGESLSVDESKYLNSEIHADAMALNILSIETGKGVLSLESTKGKAIKTWISFSMPVECIYDQPVTIENDEDKTKITIVPIREFWTDPMFELFMDYKIGGVGWSYFSDLSSDSEGRFCHVIIEIDGLFAPDVELLENTYRSVDFKEKEQIEGRAYYPHKELAVKKLLDGFDVLKDAIRLKSRNDISANMFSNYIVQYVDSGKMEKIYEKMIALTCHDSFSKARSKFLEKLSSRNLNDAYIGVRQLLENTAIESERNLKEFVIRTLELVVKKNVEDEGGYRYLWCELGGVNNVPHSEPNMQPYILGLLKVIYEFMGIQISRECVSANGEIDFLVTYRNTRNDPLRVCVEMKLAHNAKLQEGLTKQLPRYMKAERAKQGVFLVLWFKGKTIPYVFNEPSKYDDLVELENSLQSINSDRNIAIVTIDCNKPVSPSKL